MRKKILLSALLSGLATSTVADPLAIKFNAAFDFKGIYTTQKQTKAQSFTGTNITPNNQHLAFNSQANIRATIHGKSEEVDYGAVIVIKPMTRETKGSSSNGSHLYISDPALGKIEIGSPYSVISTMSMSAGALSPTFGAFTSFVNLDPNNRGMDYVDTSDLYLDSVKGDNPESTRKINVYSPKLNGFQVGFSYTPDVSNVGDKGVSTLGRGAKEWTRENGINGAGKGKIGLKNVFSLGLTYEHNIADGQMLNLAVTGEFSPARPMLKPDQPAAAAAPAGGGAPVAPAQPLVNQPLAKLKSMHVGAMYTMGCYSIVGSYGTVGKSLTNPTFDGTKRKGSFYTAGLGYRQGNIDASLTYLYINHKGNKLKAVSLASSIKTLPGLKHYIDITRFMTNGRYIENAKTLKEKVRGTVFVLGTKVNI